MSKSIKLNDNDILTIYKYIGDSDSDLTSEEFLNILLKQPLSSSLGQAILDSLPPEQQQPINKVIDKIHKII